MLKSYNRESCFEAPVNAKSKRFGWVERLGSISELVDSSRGILNSTCIKRPLLFSFLHMKARARHILVKSKEECESLKAKIEAGDDFAKLASVVSECPSGRSGGDLGECFPRTNGPRVR
jgi:hypothetical protein